MTFWFSSQSPHAVPSGEQTDFPGVGHVPVESPGTEAGVAALGLGGGEAGIGVVAGGAGGVAVVLGLGGLTGWTLTGALGAVGASGAGEAGARAVAVVPPQLPTGGVSGSLPILWALLPRFP